MVAAEWLLSDEMVIKKYQEGLSLPINSDIVMNAELPDKMENWKAFAEMTKISRCLLYTSRCV